MLRLQRISIWKYRTSCITRGVVAGKILSSWRHLIINLQVGSLKVLVAVASIWDNAYYSHTSWMILKLFIEMHCSLLKRREDKKRYPKERYLFYLSAVYRSWSGLKIRVAKTILIFLLIILNKEISVLSGLMIEQFQIIVLYKLIKFATMVLQMVLKYINLNQLFLVEIELQEQQLKNFMNAYCHWKQHIYVYL